MYFQKQSYDLIATSCHMVAIFSAILNFEHKLIYLLQTNQHLEVFCGFNFVKNTPDKSIPSTIRVSGIRFTFGGHFGHHLELCKNAQVCHSCHLAPGRLSKLLMSAFQTNARTKRLRNFEGYVKNPKCLPAAILKDKKFYT